MVSIDSRLKRTLAAAALSLLGTIAPSILPAQPDVPAPGARTDLQDQITARIAEQEARYGPYSPQLIEAWTDLAQYYRDEGIGALEAAAIMQAAQISRATYGLYSLEQVPLLQQLLRSHEKLGDAAGVWDLERELMELANKHPRDPRTASIWIEIGDHRIQALERYSSGEKPPELVLGCYYVQSTNVPGSQPLFGVPAYAQSNCTSGRRSVALGNMYWDAQSKYERASKALIRQRPYDIDELRALDMKILTNAYRYRERIIGSYLVGAEALQRLYRYDQVTGEPAPGKAASLVQLADWDLLNATNTDKTGWSPADDRPTKALATYEQAYALLVQDGATRAKFDELFPPAAPTVLPTFAPNPLAEQPEEGATGFIDVEFDITKYGRSADIRVLDTTSNASRAARNRLTRLIMVSRFRPVVTKGRFDTARVTVRYYVSEPVTAALTLPNVRTD